MYYRICYSCFIFILLTSPFIWFLSQPVIADGFPTIPFSLLGAELTLWWTISVNQIFWIWQNFGKFGIWFDDDMIKTYRYSGIKFTKRLVSLSIRFYNKVNKMLCIYRKTLQYVGESWWKRKLGNSVFLFCEGGYKIINLFAKKLVNFKSSLLDDTG